jgi:hypothetical protein
VTKALGTQLPSAIAGLLDGRDLASREGLLLLLITAAEDGQLHVAMLSVGEVVAMDPGRLRLALWPRSTSVQHLEARGRGLLYLVADGAGYAIDVRATAVGELREDGIHAAVFEAVINEVREDRVTYAELTEAPSFRLVNRERELARWRRTVDAMQRLPGEVPSAPSAPPTSPPDSAPDSAPTSTAEAPE